MFEQHNIEVEPEPESAKLRLDIRPKRSRRRRILCRLLFTIPALAVALVGLVLLDVALESHLLARIPVAIYLRPAVCSPDVVNASSVQYHSDHSYYSQLKDQGALPAPIFQDGHVSLCDQWTRRFAKYSYCLPISGRKDTPFCETPDRLDLLDANSSDSICYASVLHMLLIEVYEELQATDNSPFLAFGSLLGAVRNQSLIPFTEDVDIGYVGDLKQQSAVQEALWHKGYHMFHYNIWRVCVAPTHPLAGKLFNASLPITKEYTVPYVDLYRMKQKRNGDWDLQESRGRNLPDRRVRPFSNVTVNGMQFETVNDPKYFLKKEYGSGYMTPKPRRRSQ